MYQNGLGDIYSVRGPPLTSSRVKMSTSGRRASLICSALLSTIVISCGGPPVYVVAPAPAPAPVNAPQGGLQEAPPGPAPAAPPPQVQEVPLAPAPAAPPPPAAAPLPKAPEPVPAPGPLRPGGASRLVDGADAGTVSGWWKEIQGHCKRETGNSKCVTYRVQYQTESGEVKSDGPKSKYNDCTINKENVRPRAAATSDEKISSGIVITLDIDPSSCLDQQQNQNNQNQQKNQNQRNNQNQQDQKSQEPPPQ
jgi:hypothetical protein